MHDIDVAPLIAAADIVRLADAATRKDQIGQAIVEIDRRLAEMTKKK